MTGAQSALAHPGLVCDVAIGQSTLLTQRVIANLFYRGLVLSRAPLIGDTLRTSTEVVALRQNSAKPGRAATGLAALRIRTVDQEDRRGARLLPLRDAAAARPARAQTGHADDLAHDRLPSSTAPRWPAAVARLGPGPLPRELVGASAPRTLRAGTVWKVAGGDVVSSAPELARLTLNIAAAHHDAASTRPGAGSSTAGTRSGSPPRSATRALPNLVTIVAWHGCDHLGARVRGRHADAARSSSSGSSRSRRRPGEPRCTCARVSTPVGEPAEDGAPGARLALSVAVSA